MNWLKRLMGQNDPKPRNDPKARNPEPSATDPGVIAEDDPRIAAGHAMLDAYWATVGRVDADVLSYMINPQFQGAPAWPNMRQAFRVVRTDTALILASDGLCDPFVGTNMDDTSGFGMEVFAEFPGLQEMSQADIMDSAAFGFIESVARNMANFGGITGRLDQYGVLSMEVPVPKGFGPSWTNGESMSGVLLGMPVADRQTRLDLPFGPVRLVPVTLLHLDELAQVATGGAAARQAMADALIASGTGHCSDTRSQCPWPWRGNWLGCLLHALPKRKSRSCLSFLKMTPPRRGMRRNTRCPSFRARSNG